MEFKDFLKKHKENDIEFPDNCLHTEDLNRESICIVCLGEWAWSGLSDDETQNEISLIEIAIACLGETEIKKRLKELK